MDFTKYFFKDVVHDSLWVMVDSDGEEDEESSVLSLRENDLVSLLNQIKIDDLFRAVLLIEKKNCQVSSGFNFH